MSKFTNYFLDYVIFARLISFSAAHSCEAHCASQSPSPWRLIVETQSVWLHASMRSLYCDGPVRLRDLSMRWRECLGYIRSWDFEWKAWQAWRPILQSEPNYLISFVMAYNPWEWSMWRLSVRSDTYVNSCEFKETWMHANILQKREWWGDYINP